MISMVNSHFFPKQSEVESVREQYPVGCRVEVVEINDQWNRLPAGLQGIVACVDDCGTVHVNWDNGSCLGAVYGEDIIKRV